MTTVLPLAPTLVNLVDAYARSDIGIKADGEQLEGRWLGKIQPLHWLVCFILVAIIYF